jgi:hypothetical protein
LLVVKLWYFFEGTNEMLNFKPPLEIISQYCLLRC